MHFQTRILSSGTVLCLLLTLFFPLSAQQQAESADYQMVLQRGAKERTIQTGDHIEYKLTGARMGFAGHIDEIHPDYLVVDRHMIPVNELRQISAMPPRPHRWMRAMTVGCLALLVLGASWISRAVFMAFSGPTFNSGTFRDYVLFNNLTVLTSAAMGFIALTVALFKRRNFRLTKWKLSVQKRKE